MKLSVVADRIDKIKSDLVAIPCFEVEKNEKKKIDAPPLPVTWRELVEREAASGDFKAEAGSFALVRPATGGVARLLLWGLGQKEKLNLRRLRNHCADLSRRVKKLQAADLAVVFRTELLVEGADAAYLGQACAEGFELARYEGDFLKSEKKKKARPEISRLAWLSDRERGARLVAGAKKGLLVAEIVNRCRRLINTPGNLMTPAILAETMKKEGLAAGVKVRVLGQADIKKEKMGGMLAVSSGSQAEPRFVIMEYAGGKSGAPPFVLVGKGITFDSGGISLKPAADMHEMKADMTGAAVVFGAVLAAARLGLKLNVVALAALAENLPSGSAARPGDVITSRRGLTVEVQNTDAEGRLVLMDALDYARSLKPKAIVDIATLTGAAIVALGSQCCAVLGNNEELIATIRGSGERTGERSWQLPLFEEYDDQLKSDIGDLRNIGGREAGTITAAMFLKRFVDDKTPWAHLDIAGVDWSKKSSGINAPGGTAFGLRLLLDLLEQRARL